jgi:hypothetical protein
LRSHRGTAPQGGAVAPDAALCPCAALRHSTGAQCMGAAPRRGVAAPPCGAVPRRDRRRSRDQGRLLGLLAVFLPESMLPLMSQWPAACAFHRSPLRFLLPRAVAPCCGRPSRSACHRRSAACAGAGPRTGTRTDSHIGERRRSCTLQWVVCTWLFGRRAHMGRAMLFTPA